MKRKYTQLICTNLKDKLKEIEKNPPPIVGFSISRLEYLLSLILTHKQEKHRGSYSLLNMQYMKNVIPKANGYLDFLRKESVIEWVNYSAGRNSRLYRLMDEGKTEYQEISDKKIILRIEQNRRNLLLRNSKKYPFLNEHIHRVKIDVNEAVRTIEKEYSKNIRNKDEHAEGRRTFSLSAISKIESGEIYIGVNKTNGRLDSNYTSLPSELIQHLTINGKHLVEIDIKNSQLFFASAFLDPDPTPEMVKLFEKYLDNPHIISSKILEISDKVDVTIYRKLATRGKFYEYMMEKFRDNNIPYKDRADLKQQMFVVLFGKNNSYKYNKAAKLFKETFPNVQKVFEMIKKKNHNALAIFLQRLESYCVLERISRRINEELPGIPLITRHDSILPTSILIDEDNILEVELIIISTIKEITGSIPKVKIK